jgi:hypothetical protein
MELPVSSRTSLPWTLHSTDEPPGSLVIRNTKGENKATIHGPTQAEAAAIQHMLKAVNAPLGMIAGFHHGDVPHFFRPPCKMAYI